MKSKLWIVAVRQRDNISTLDWFRVFEELDKAKRFYKQLTRLLPPIYEIYLAEVKESSINLKNHSETNQTGQR